MTGARSPEERKADVLALLATPGLDAWVATSSADGVVHLVPLSVAWDGRSLVLATEPTAVTTRNLERTRRVRLGLGQTRDVVMIDADVRSSTDAGDAPAGIVEAYLTHAGWDPRDAGVPFVVHVLTPVRIQAWREVNEIEGRTLMRDGRWLVA